MSFIDVIVGTALILIIFLALFGLLRASVVISQLTKSKAVATAVAESQMEYVRSLNYDVVGTVGGIPAGDVPQFSTTTSNGIGYGVRTFIEYADDPADGLSSLDTNHIITDYKHIKVTVNYRAGGKARTIELVSNYSPIGLETTNGGGTLQLVIVDASGMAVPGASVHIVNTNLAPTVDVTTFSDSTGIVYLPGALPSSQYQIDVSKAGYSSAQTYARDTTNQNPTPGYLTVAKDLTTTSTFAIDRLSTLTMHTYMAIVSALFHDTFADASNIAMLNSAQVSAGSIILANPGTGYALSGSAISSTLAPTYLASWMNASSTSVMPASTAAAVHVVDGSGALLPDSALPGNSTGFTGIIDLSGVSTTTYPALALKVDLATTDTLVTPQLQDWGIAYKRGPVPVPNVPFTLTGAKTIGSTGTGAPIYKTILATSTGATGTNALSLEWDSYGLALPGYDTTDACNAPPYALSPNTNAESALYLGPSTPNSLLVSVRDSSNAAISGASVTLSRTGYTNTVVTSTCGGAYFGGIAASSAYTITVSKTGYTTDTTSNVNISGHIFYANTL